MSAPAPDAALEEAIRGVADPEMPEVTLGDLGIVRDVRVHRDGGHVHVEVDLTPTYTGCPATETITADVQAAAARLGATCTTRHVLAPAWSTEWITKEGKEKLAAAGIAPPGPVPHGPVAIRLTVQCPQCRSGDTRETSRFGSSPCTSLHVCNTCQEPFPAVRSH